MPPTDLDTMEHLRSLNKTIERVWHKLHQIDEVRRLIQDIESAENELKQSEQVLRQIESEFISEAEKKKESIEAIKNKAGQILDHVKAVEKRISETINKFEPLIRKLSELASDQSLLQQIQSILDETKRCQSLLAQALEECRQETMAIREFEEYVRQFRKYRSGRQLRSFLYRELGFAGLVVYILHLLAPRRRNG
jgi:DNA repair exonuclease SbcCD ATPase subunit